MEETTVAVTAFILNNDQILLLKRSEKETFFPGVFEMPSGKLDFGENPYEGLVREAKEETALDVKVLKPLHVFDYMSKDDSRYNIEIIFLCELKDTDQEITLSDHDEYVWAGKGRMRHLLSEDNPVLYEALESSWDKME